jgi:hypothetical protein
VSCGILDQMASSLADTDHMLFLDTRTLERQILPFPTGAEIVVIDSGVARSLATSGYNQRRAECEAAAEQLGVKALRDITDPQQAEQLPDPLRQRARHVITENNRVLKALEGITPEAFRGTDERLPCQPARRLRSFCPRPRRPGRHSSNYPRCLWRPPHRRWIWWGLRCPSCQGKGDAIALSTLERYNPHRTLRPYPGRLIPD